MSVFTGSVHFEYAYNYKNVVGTFIIIDYSEPTAKKNINNLLDIYSKQAKPKHLKKSIVIISKKKIVNDIVLNVNFNNLDNNNYHVAKKRLDDFQDYISELQDFVGVKYNQSWLDLIDFSMEEPIEKISTLIYESAIIEKHLANRYAPIILALYDFFEFLRKNYYIAQEDYDKFMNLCGTIYGAENTQIDISDTNTNVDPIVVFTKTIYELYTNNIELFSDHNIKQPFRYSNTKNKKEMICFNYIADVISFIKNNKDKIGSYNDFNNVFIDAESTEELLQQIRDSLIEKKLQVVNKNRKDYRIKSQSYFALDVAKLKEFIAQ